ncbi:hypothetical protein [Sphingorhabdus sp.]|jgi:hypothetical protein|uniref:hypothetical protein n=1 Tax=Sphingorhabdus sp. TaxID=1902408 RepID=UPI0037CBDAE5
MTNRILLGIAFAIFVTLAILNWDYSNRAVFYGHVMAALVLGFTLAISFIKRPA